ncbi:MAG: RNA polymerase factor sigma-32 [Halobacteriovoraceae bacterium]|nr:RNA polymerase factor sigma-32 [Halobacteriovoraceae bacterium]
MAKKLENKKVEILSKEDLKKGDSTQKSKDIDARFKEVAIDGQAIDQETLQQEKLSNDLEILSSKDLAIYKPKDLKDPLYQYLEEVSKYKLLTIEEEKELLEKLKNTGDIETAKKLVTANLRLVVKIAMEYRNAYQNVMDLIQEGNIGLMKAVSKYDSSKGAKLSYYASWWIRSYILKFILDNFRLIKIGTTNEQKKLFYNLLREKERLIARGLAPDTKLISDSLGVSQKAVDQMDQRLGSSGIELSIDTPLKNESTSTIGDMIQSDEIALEDKVSQSQDLRLFNSHLQDFIGKLKKRDKEIFAKRLLSDDPPSLQSIADSYGITRERVRQIESRLIQSLKSYMSQFLR